TSFHFIDTGFLVPWFRIISFFVKTRKGKGLIIFFTMEGTIRTKKVAITQPSKLKRLSSFLKAIKDTAVQPTMQTTPIILLIIIINFNIYNYIIDILFFIIV